MTSEKEGHNLIAQLGVAHRLPLGITHLKKRVEQISARLIQSAPLADDPFDDFVQIPDGAAPHWRQEVRKIEREEECLARIRYESVGHNLHGFADSFSDPGNFRSKQALRNNLQSHGHHVLVHVA